MASSYAPVVQVFRLTSMRCLGKFVSVWLQFVCLLARSGAATKVAVREHEKGRQGEGERGVREGESRRRNDEWGKDACLRRERRGEHEEAGGDEVTKVVSTVSAGLAPGPSRDSWLLTPGSGSETC